MRVKRIARWASHDYDDHEFDDHNFTWLIIPLCESKGSPDGPPMIMTIMSMMIKTLPGLSYHYASQKDHPKDLLVAKVWSPSDWLGLRGRTCQQWLCDWPMMMIVFIIIVIIVIVIIIAIHHSLLGMMACLYIPGGASSSSPSLYV